MKTLESLSKYKKSFDQYAWPLNLPMYEKTQGGDVGIEIELEGQGLVPCSFRKDGIGWTLHNDGSLRNGGLEYVLERPVPFSDVPEFVTALYKELSDSQSVLNDSNRTSVHIHLNCQGLKPHQVCSLISLWGIFEDILVNYCGEYRVGNLFALRLRDAEFTVGNIVNSFKQGRWQLGNDNRYSAMNVVSLDRFGSLEIRSMKGCHTPDEIITWVNILQGLYEYAINFNVPTEILVMASGLGPRGLAEAAFGSNVDLVWTDDSSDSDSIWDGIRRVQPIIHSLPWDDLLDEINRKPLDNPFKMKLNAAPGRLRTLNEDIAEQVEVIRRNRPEAHMGMPIVNRNQRIDFDGRHFVVSQVEPAPAQEVTWPIEPEPDLPEDPRWDDEERDDF